MIITLTGSNSFLLQQELSQLTDNFISEFGDLNLERLDGEEASAERLIEAIHSLPFLAAKKLVVLRSPGAHKDFADRIEDLIKAVPEEVEVVIVEPKIDRRSSYFKVLKTKTDYREFVEPEAGKLNTWIVQLVQQQGGKISLADASYLVERVGQNQQLLYNELGKLLTYQPEISRTNVDLLTEKTPQSTIFELIDSAFANNPKRTIELYKQQRALKVEPQQIIAMLAWQLHVLALVKTAGNRTADQIASQAKINPFVVRKSQGIASKIGLTELKQLISRALSLDVRLKSQSIDADEALQHFLLTIA